MKRLTIVLVSCALVAPALGQPDPLSVWWGFKGNADKHASVAAAGPATELGWILELPADPNDPSAISVIPSQGGITVAGNGDLYFKSHDDVGSYVYRVHPHSGKVLARSVNLGGGLGGYGGVAIGTDKVYVCIHPGAMIKVLDKSTLTVLATWTNAAFGGLRGTPLIGSVLNDNGHPNLYIHDRNGLKIHAVDSDTGALMWTYVIPYATSFGQLGPMWVLGDGRQAIGYFGDQGNPAVAPASGFALADNGDNTFEVLWHDTGPRCFNWWGSGALSSDGSRIYVTTFNDCDGGTASALWAVDTATGAEIWSVPGDRGDPNSEFNFFGRPSVVGSRVYCGGGWGVVACFEDMGATYALKWAHRSKKGEFTSVSTAVDGGTVYVYGAKQGVSEDPNDPNDPNGFHERYVVLRDDGATYTVLHRSILNMSAATSTLFANNSTTVDPQGSVYVGMGNANGVAGVNPGAVYKFKLPCPNPGAGCTADIDGDCVIGNIELQCILDGWAKSEGDLDFTPGCDYDGDGTISNPDLQAVLDEWAHDCS
jgi:hypothetical protein